MPLQNFWFSRTAEPRHQRLQDFGFGAFLCSALVGYGPWFQTPAPIDMAQTTTPPEGGVVVWLV
jgi:hypothetical protein